MYLRAKFGCSTPDCVGGVSSQKNKHTDRDLYSKSVARRHSQDLLKPSSNQEHGKELLLIKQFG